MCIASKMIESFGFTQLKFRSTIVFHKRIKNTITINIYESYLDDEYTYSVVSRIGVVPTVLYLDLHHKMLFEKLLTLEDKIEVIYNLKKEK